MDYKYMNNNRMWETDVPVGSVVHLVINNGDAGTAIILKNNSNITYDVYRIEFGDTFEIHATELTVIWMPDER